MEEDWPNCKLAWGALIVLLVVGVWASLEPNGPSGDPWASSGDPVTEEMGGFDVDADFLLLFARQLGREILPTSLPRFNKALSSFGHGPSPVPAAAPAESSPRPAETGAQDFAGAGIP